MSSNDTNASSGVNSAEVDRIFKKIAVYKDKQKYKTNADKKFEVDLIFDKLNNFHEKLIEQQNARTSLDWYLENKQLDSIFGKIK